MSIDKLSHTSWKCKYHIVFAPKYRRQVIYNQIKKRHRENSTSIHSCPSMLGFVKSFCGISDFFLKILSFQSKFPLTHALMSCKAIYF